MAAVDPAVCVARAVDADPSLLSPDTAVLAIGKAAPAMFRAYARIAGEAASRMMLTIDGAGAPSWACIGDHPLPTARNIAHAQAVARFVAAAPALTVLLSGGASALLSLPAPGVTLDDLTTITRAMLRAGATVDELNAVRKHVEQLKGGHLALLAEAKPITVFVLSDVVGNRLDVIGSGPCTADPTTYADALAILERRNLLDASPAITSVLRDGTHGLREETPKPGDDRLARVRHEIIADNAMAVDVAAVAARSLGFDIASMTTGVQGEAREVGEQLARDIADVSSTSCPACIILGGETTVAVGEAPGRGGRNHELALAAAIALDEINARDIAIATFATDGLDGDTRAAGAIVTHQTSNAAKDRGLDPADALARHDSGTVFERLGFQIITGPTGTNVNDLAIALRYTPSS